MKHLTGTAGSLNTIRLIILAGILILAFILVYNIIKTSEYIKVDATVVSTDKSIDYDTDSDSKTSVIKSIKCKYEYENKEYESAFRTFIKKYSVGKTISVYINPGNPSEIRNPFITEVCFLGIEFLVCFIILLSAIQRRSHGD